MVDPDMAPQAWGRAEGALTQATGELFHGLESKGGKFTPRSTPGVPSSLPLQRNPAHLAMLLLHVGHILIPLRKPGVTQAAGPAPSPPTPTFGAFAPQVPSGAFGGPRRLRGAGQLLSGGGGFLSGRGGLRPRHG